MDDVEWENCLLKSYKKDTGYKLTEFEFETNGQKGTWKVSYSKITLPSGGKAIKKTEKIEHGIPTTVYCKRYSKKVVLCANGSRWS
jgi:hypothetical protein